MLLPYHREWPAIFLGLCKSIHLRPHALRGNPRSLPGTVESVVRQVLEQPGNIHAASALRKSACGLLWLRLSLLPPTSILGAAEISGSINGRVPAPRPGTRH